MKGLDKLFSQISRTNLLDWREFNFFKPTAGLSGNDQLSPDWTLARSALPE
jgi:hypothetical protein